MQKTILILAFRNASQKDAADFGSSQNRSSHGCDFNYYIPDVKIAIRTLFVRHSSSQGENSLFASIIKTKRFCWLCRKGVFEKSVSEVTPTDWGSNQWRRREASPQFGEQAWRQRLWRCPLNAIGAHKLRGVFSRSQPWRQSQQNRLIFYIV